MTYRYYCPMRPPGPGAIPRGATRIDYAGDDGTLVDEEGHVIEAWGMVEYDHRLTDAEIVAYELEEAR